MSMVDAWPDNDPDAKSVCVTVEDEDMGNVLVDGRRVGRVDRGINREWYFVSLSRVSHAYPLEGLDNVSGTGLKSPMEAALCGLNLSVPGGAHHG